ncbi:MAG: Mur ligase domain-containing protein [Clostridiales bacterium]|nr:Mur ligase domain-containing protein [Clostridiales bacterium]
MNQPNLSDLNKFHFIGIGGIGMSGIVKIMLSQDRGYLISGSDVQKSSLLDDLAVLGARIRIGHHENNLPEDTQAVVYTSAISQDNPELASARRRGLLLLPRAALLAFLMEQKRSIGVAGAH